MTLSDILRSKGSTVYTIEPQATLAEAVDRLIQHNCGSLVVCAGSRASDVRGGGDWANNDSAHGLLGIITERDILRACARHRSSLDQARVAEMMTSDVIIATPDDSVEETMGRMTEHRMRHLPVVEDDRLVGIVSIGDVVKAQHNSLMMENHFLKSYIQS
jgi:CBS domain-containing protein